MRKLIATVLICIFALVHYAVAMPLELDSNAEAHKNLEVQVDDTCPHCFDFSTAATDGKSDSSMGSSSAGSDCFLDCVHALPAINTSLVHGLPVHGYVASIQLSDQFLDSHRPPPKLV